jgi:hypothetical protein
MTPKIILETEPHIKKRYQFAASAFVRMWGRNSMNDYRIVDFCVEWAYKEENAPLSGLNEVDQYFYYEFKTWRGY